MTTPAERAESVRAVGRVNLRHDPRGCVPTRPDNFTLRERETVDILTLADRVADGAYNSDRFPVTSELRADGETVTFTYTLQAAMQHAQTILSRVGGTEWQGVITPSCEDRTRTEVVSRDVGVGLRIGGEAGLCFTCGPEGGHYHPSDGESMDSVMTVARRLSHIAERDA